MLLVAKTTNSICESIRVLNWVIWDSHMLGTKNYAVCTFSHGDFRNGTAKAIKWSVENVTLQKWMYQMCFSNEDNVEAGIANNICLTKKLETEIV